MGFSSSAAERNKNFPVGRGQTFRRYSGLPLEAGMAADGQAGHCRRLAAGDCRGLPAETKGGKGTVWFPCPLLTPPNPP